MKLSVIIPVYNSLSLLDKCINSITSQSFSDLEIIVVDAGSNDGTQEYLESLPSNIKWISEPDKGIYNAMNKGLALSNGEWLYFLGADDKLLNSEVLSIVFQNKLDDVQVISGNVVYEGGRLKSKKPSWNWLIWLRNNLHHQGTFYHKDLFSNTKYSEDNNVLSDYEFNLSLYKKKTPYYLIETDIALCGLEGVSKSFNWSLYNEEIKIKTRLTTKFFLPFFWSIGVAKYLLKGVF